MTDTLSLESMLDQDSELFSLPEIYIHVSELLENDDTTSAQIGQAVETDPALSSRILKMVNSAFYGFPRTIASISQAISILGRDRLRQILIGTVLSGVFGRAQNDIFFMEDFWYHSVKTAILARHLGTDSQLSDQTESLFTAGLLHEIGRLILAQKQPQIAGQIQKAIELDDEDIYAAEQRLLGFTHCDLGAAFIEKWGLPPLLVEVARHHHHPQQAKAYQSEVDLVYLANNLVFLVAPISREEVEFALEDIAGWQKTGLSVEQILEACSTADEQVYQVMEILGMVQMKIDLEDDN